MAGYDQNTDSTHLYWMDYLATLAELPYCAHGYGGYFTLSTMDAYYKEDMTPEEGLELMKKCISEISKRLIINLPTFRVKIVDKNGEALSGLQIDMMRCYLNDALDKINKYAKEAINAFATGDEQKMMLLGLKRFTKSNPFNSKEARRRIADKLIADSRYSF